MKNRITKGLITFVCCMALIICSYNNGFNAGKRHGETKLVYVQMPKVEFLPPVMQKEKVEEIRPTETPKPLVTETPKVEIAQTPAPTTEPIKREQETGLVSIGMFTTTAYCPCAKCCGKSDGITATGTVATAGRTIASDPSVLPYGTEVVINGNTYTVEDCGGGVNGNHIDIFFDSHSAALSYGRRSVEVFVRR